MDDDRPRSKAQGGPLEDALKDSPFFSVLREDQLGEIAEAASQAAFRRGQVIVKQGDASTTFYVILKGLVEVRHGGRALTRLGPGRFFGETALVSESAYAATVAAVEPTECLAMDGSVLRSYPALVVKLLEEATRRNRAMVLKGDLASPSNAPSLALDEEVGFGSAKTKLLFECMLRQFTEDYMMKRRYLEQAGWRTLGEIAAAAKIPHSTLYGKNRNFGPQLGELVSRGLVETRVFSGQRGRGGEVLKVRIAYDREPVKRYVDRNVLSGR